MIIVSIALGIALFYFVLNIVPQIFCFYNCGKFSKLFKSPGLRELLANIRNGESVFWFEELRKRYGPRFCIWFGPKLSLFLSDPEDVRYVLASPKLLYKSDNYQILDQWLKKSIITSGGITWHKQRKMMTPAFHFKILGEFKQPMEDMCNIMIDKLMEKANGQAIEIYSYVTLLTLDIIGITALGTPLNAQLQNTQECREYVSAVQTICRLIHKQSFSLWRRYTFLFKLTNDYKLQQHALNILRSTSRRVLEKRRETFEASNIRTLADAEKADEHGVKKRLALLDMLLLHQMEEGKITDDHIQVDVDATMFAGHDTTSSAISFAIYLLSLHKNVQQKAYEEAVAMKGKEKETMKYLESVIKETLRLFPSAPMFSRMAKEDIKIRDLKIPAGTSIMIQAYSLHRNEKYYPDPERFNPERFLDDEIIDKTPYAFVAFSAGPRNCLGQKYAMLEIKVVLSMVLRAFEIFPVVGFEPILTADITLKSKNGLCVRLKKREIEPLITTTDKN